MKAKKLMLAALAMFTVSAQAAEWLDQPVRIVVPYPPGGNVDVAARLIAPGLEERFGQTFVVENRAGAGGLIAGEYVARSAPDGNTLFMAANGPLLFSPIIFNRPAYHWREDFEPISTVSFTPMVMQAHPSVPADTFQELIDYSKANPDELNMASPGAGTSNHLVSELLMRETGANWMTIHYKGNAPATTDLLGGQVHFNFDQLSVALPFIQKGQLKPLAVTARERIPALPNVPTIAEAGLTGFNAYTFTGLLAPKGTPDEVIQRVSAALKEILAEPELVERFQTMGAEARSTSPEAFLEYLEAEDARWIPIIESVGIDAK